LELHYKVDTYIDHVARFSGDQPMELGDQIVWRIKKNITTTTIGLPG